MKGEYVLRVYLAMAAGLTCLVAGAGTILGSVVVGLDFHFYLWAMMCLVMAIVAGFLLIRVPQQEIGTLVASTQALIKGSLIGATGAFRSAELTDLQNGLNRMRERMIEYLRTIDENTAVLEETGAQVTVVAELVSHASQNQAGMVQEIMAGIERLATEANVSAKDAENAALAAGQSDHAAREGEDAVKSLIRDINSISAKIEEFKEMSSKIRQIVRTVSVIAGDTNLLALNAAVEAARVGSLGCGFAVVAEEVGRLAKDAAHAASRIRETVNDMETCTGKTVSTALNVGQLAEDVEKTFVRIRELAGLNAGTAGELAGVCHKQAANTELMVQKMERITEITEDAMAIAEETSANIQEMTTLAGRFKKILGIFIYREAGGQKA